jgi:hypothetical protein
MFSLPHRGLSLSSTVDFFFFHGHQQRNCIRVNEIQIFTDRAADSELLFLFQVLGVVLLMLVIDLQ